MPTSLFGPRGGGFHPGVDLTHPNYKAIGSISHDDNGSPIDPATYYDIPIKAAAAGIVTRVKGDQVSIQHTKLVGNDTYYTFYCHMKPKSITVKRVYQVSQLLKI